MGDPKKQRKKFTKPGHPWQKERIEAEKDLLKQYGLKRKNEIWKMNSMLKKFLHRAKKIIGERSAQSDLERGQLLQRLYLLGLLKKDSKIEDVLNLKLKDIMERRLQTFVFRNGIAKTMHQAREFIIHEHIAVGSKKVTAPSYLVSINEEPYIKLMHQIMIAEQTNKHKAEVKAE